MHMTFGFWSGIFLLILGLSGSIMGYRWAEGLLFSIAGNGDGSRQGGDGKAEDGFSVAALDSLMRGASEKAPDWRMVTIRLPRKSGAPATAMIEEPGWLEFPHRSRLAADPVSGALMEWEPYAKQSAGKKWRSWMMPLHTGRGFGIVGQCVAAFAAFSLALLVWTGLSLGLRRTTGLLKNRRGGNPGSSPSQTGLRPNVPGLQRNGYRPWKRK
jgi:uncharacterized iron-regulated membrane protein